MRFYTNQYYHLYNRGVDKRQIFTDKKDYERFLLGMKLFNDIQPIGSIRDLFQTFEVRNSGPRRSGKQLIEIITYCLLPNHFHLILKQLTNNGISIFLQRWIAGYTKYFNKKYDRSGVLFQGKTKSKHIDSDEYLLWLSAYVNCNSEIHKIKKAKGYTWSSYDDYLEDSANDLPVSKNIILGNFKNFREYERFCQNAIPTWQEKKEMQKYLLE